MGTERWFTFICSFFLKKPILRCSQSFCNNFQCSLLFVDTFRPWRYRLHILCRSKNTVFFYTCCCFSMQTNIDKHRGNHEVITQSPASEQEVEQGNNQGYKGMIHSSVFCKASCRCDYNVQNAGINLVLCLHVPSLHLLFIAFSIASSCSTNPVAFALVLSCKIASKKHLK